MNAKDLVQQSIYLITEYYRGNLEPFFETISDDILWIGPRSGQIIQGKESILKAWGEEQHQLLFSMGNIEVFHTSTGRNNQEVLLEYYVYTHFPDGKVDKHHQRIHFSWGRFSAEKDGERTSVLKVCMIHISNLPLQLEDTKRVYASSPSESQEDAVNTIYSSVFFRTVPARGTDEITYYLNSVTILWIESADSGRHSIIHSTEGTYRAVERLRYFEEQFSNVLIRIHSSYLINPLYVRSIRRFEVTLTDGTELSIPEKKYTAVRKRLADWSLDAAGRKPLDS